MYLNIEEQCIIYTQHIYVLWILSTVLCVLNFLLWMIQYVWYHIYIWKISETKIYNRILRNDRKFCTLITQFRKIYLCNIQIYIVLLPIRIVYINQKMHELTHTTGRISNTNETNSFYFSRRFLITRRKNLIRALYLIMEWSDSKF